MMRLRRAAAPPRLPPADVLLRAAALLRGGVSSARLWRVLVDENPRHEPGDGQEWRVAAAAWHLATTTGAPVAPALERLAFALRELERVAGRRSVLLAGPKSTVRLVAALPLFAMLLGAVLGFDPLPVLATPLGVLLLVTGLGLLAAGVWWARALTGRLERLDAVAGLECELMWIALSGGLSPAGAARAAVEHADRARAAWVRLDRFRRDGPVFAVLELATVHGTPVSALLLSEAEGDRKRALARIESAAERLGVRVLVPLAVCVLPAFVLLGVVPVLLAVLGNVVA